MEVRAEGDLKELILTGRSKRYKSVARNPSLMLGLKRAVQIMMSVTRVEELSTFSYLHYERLKHELSGYSSVRLSNKTVHRLLFIENPDGITLRLIEIDDTHYGNK